MIHHWAGVCLCVFRASIKRREGSRRPALCTHCCRRLWRRNTPKTPPTSWIRYCAYMWHACQEERCRDVNICFDFRGNIRRRPRKRLPLVCTLFCQRRSRLNTPEPPLNSRARWVWVTLHYTDTLAFWISESFHVLSESIHILALWIVSYLDSVNHLISWLSESFHILTQWIISYLDSVNHFISWLCESFHILTLNRFIFWLWLFPQNKYKRSGKQENSSSIYSQLPQTQETQFAKQMADLQSDVRTCVCVCVIGLCVCDVDHVMCVL